MGPHPGEVTREGTGECCGTTRRRSADLFATLHGDESPDGRARSRARDELVHLHLPLVQHCARRFRDRGEPYEDLVQVGTIGLLKAVDRYAPDRGVEFSTYATPTVIGEIRRHFRDRGSVVRVPRRLQELRTRIGIAAGELGQSLGRSPTPRELADAVGCAVEEVLEALESATARVPVSLDVAVGDALPGLAEAGRRDDDALHSVVVRESVRPLLDALDPREKKILLLRFFRNRTQSQIAEEIGVSQMQVSRLLRRTLADLRTALEAE